MTSDRVVVAGGGITGLVAARDLALAGCSVILLEPGRLGGKLQTTPFDGGLLDEAADAFLARVPEGIELCRELGLDGDLVQPAERRAHVWSRGALRRLPAGQVLGVPTDLDELAESGILSASGLAAAAAELDRPLVAPEDDPAIGGFFGERFGAEVVDRLIDPLVGGINAGDTAGLSLAATVPQLDAAVRSGASSVIEACRAQRAAVTDPEAPVFHSPRGGMGALSATLVDELDRLGVDVVGAGIEAIEPGWVVRAGTIRLDADAVVLATPAGPSATALREVAPKPATLLAPVPYASVALLAIAAPRSSIERELDGSGYLVPQLEGRTITACSWTSAKWPHQHGADSVWLRASVGRDGRPPTADDDALVAAVLADLADTMALHGPVGEVRISRWTDSFPQYRPGHLQRVDAIDAELAAAAPGVVVAGAALRGLGVPACIRQARGAAAKVLLHLGT
jgi:oxygen-dependent protoporphyrinogen oxidase